MVGKLTTRTPRPPGFFSGFKKGAMVFLGDVASFNNFLLLSVAYFLGAGTSAIALRLFGKANKEKAGKKPDTYWIDLNIGGKPTDSYYRPF